MNTKTLSKHQDAIADLLRLSACLGASFDEASSNAVRIMVISNKAKALRKRFENTLNYPRCNCLKYLKQTERNVLALFAELDRLYLGRRVHLAYTIQRGPRGPALRLYVNAGDKAAPTKTSSFYL